MIDPYYTHEKNVSVQGSCMPIFRSIEPFVDLKFEIPITFKSNIDLIYNKGMDESRGANLQHFRNTTLAEEIQRIISEWENVPEELVKRVRYSMYIYPCNCMYRKSPVFFQCMSLKLIVKSGEFSLY